MFLSPFGMLGAGTALVLTIVFMASVLSSPLFHPLNFCTPKALECHGNVQISGCMMQCEFNCFADPCPIRRSRGFARLASARSLSS